MKNVNVLILIALFLFSSLTAQAADGMSWFSKKKTDKTAEKTAQTTPASAAPASVETKVAPVAAPSVDQNVVALRQRVANNRMLSDAQKDELIQDMLKQLPAGTDLQDKSAEQRLLLFEQVANDPNMKLDEKKASLKAHLSESKDERPETVSETVKELKTEVSEKPKTKKNNFAGNP